MRRHALVADTISVMHRNTQPYFIVILLFVDIAQYIMCYQHKFLCFAQWCLLFNMHNYLPISVTCLVYYHNDCVCAYLTIFCTCLPLFLCNMTNDMMISEAVFVHCV